MRACLSTILLLFAAPDLPRDREPGGADAGLIGSRSRRRIVKQFDFDEQKQGNFETMPRNWRPIRGPGFPRFLEARFDEHVGMSAPPSLRLPASGGSIALVYLAKDIDVRPGSEYRVVGWIRPRKMAHASACLSAYYLDHAFNPIAHSERRSPPIRGSGDDPAWKPAEVRLPGDFPQARWMAITCRVEQAATGDNAKENGLAIRHHDVDATAWFDDIAVIRLPRVGLSLESAAGVFAADGTVACQVRVADIDGAGLQSCLEIADATGGVIRSFDVKTIDLDHSPTRMEIPALAPGYHVARLVVHADGREIARRERPFVLLPDSSKPAAARTALGWTLTPDAPEHVEQISRLTELLQPRYARMPVWHSGTTEREIVHGNPNADRLMRLFDRRGIDVIAGIDAPPHVLLEKLRRPDETLHELLGGPPEPWRAYLALVITRYGGQVRAWQVGSADEPDMDAASLRSALHAVRSELRPLMVDCDLVCPARSGESPMLDLPAETVSLKDRPGATTDHLIQSLSDWSHSKVRKRWVDLTPLDDQRYHRMARLCDLARRFVLSLSAGADAVFVPQPWRFDEDETGSFIVPDEAVLIERWLSATLAGMRPVGRLWLDHVAEGWLFESERGGRGVLVAWSDADPIEPRVLADLGPSARLVCEEDRSTVLEVGDEGALIPLSAMPRVIETTDPLRMRLLAGFELEHAELREVNNYQEMVVQLTNPLPLPLSGSVVLEAPASWTVEPRQFSINVGSAATGRWPVRLRAASNRAAGNYVLLGRLLSDQVEGGRLTLRAPLSLTSAALDVSVLARSEDGRMILTQRITNRGPDTLNLRSAVICPERPRETRIISNLAAGQSTVREFVIPDSRRLAGRAVRALVEQIDGPARHNAVLRIE